MAGLGFTKYERQLVLSSALLIFSRVFGMSLVLANFRTHFENQFLTTGILIGVAFGAHGLTMALMQLPFGHLSDKYGRKPLLIIGSVLFLAGCIVCSIAPNMTILIIGRLLQGTGAIGSVALAAVGENIDPSRRTLAMALVGIPAGAGFLVGIGVGPALYPLISMAGLFLLAGAIGLVPFLLILPLHYAAPKAPADAPEARKSAIAALSLGGFTTNFMLSLTLFFLPTRDPKLLLPMLIVSFIIVGGLSRRIDKSGATWQPITIGALLIAVAAPIFAFQSGIVLLIVGTLFFATHATLQTVLPSQVSRIAGPRGGRAHGIQNLVAYTGTFAAGVIAGVFSDSAFYAFAAGFGVAALAAIAAYATLANKRPEPQPSS